MSNEIQDLSTALEGVVAGLAPSVVSVRSHRMQASGFVWRGGLIVTSDEGLAEEGDVGVTLPGGDNIAAQVVGRDPSTAIALLRCEKTDLRPAAMAVAIPSVGALAVAMGSVEGAQTAALGIVSVSTGPWHSMRGGEIDARVELDARLRRTSEGGLAVNAAGQAFGMTVFGPRRRVLVIPAVTVGRVAAKLETHGRIPRGYLGLGLQPVAVTGGGPGVMVMIGMVIMEIATALVRLAVVWVIAALWIGSAAAQRCDGVDIAISTGGQRCLKPGAGERFKDCAECPEMVVIPAGSFTMGSPTD